MWCIYCTTKVLHGKGGYSNSSNSVLQDKEHLHLPTRSDVVGAQLFTTCFVKGFNTIKRCSSEKKQKAWSPFKVVNDIISQTSLECKSYKS